MKTKAVVIISILLIISACGGLTFAADKVVVIPLTGKAKAAGTDGQFLYNSNGKIAGTDVYYDKNSGNYGIGIRTIHQDAKLEVAGQTWFWVNHPNTADSLIIGTPGGWPGIIAKTSGKRMDLSFHDGFINLASSYNESPPNLNFGLTVTDTGRIGINTLTPNTTLEVRGEIRSTDATGHNRLWGKGRPGISTVTDSSGWNCTDGGYRFHVSNTMVSWGSAAEACPEGTWVCTAAERGTTQCAPNGVSTYFEDCHGDDQDARESGNFSSYVYIPAWVADTENTSHLRGKVVRLDGGINDAPGCQYRPVWCCSN